MSVFVKAIGVCLCAYMCVSAICALCVERRM